MEKNLDELLAEYKLNLGKGNLRQACELMPNIIGSLAQMIDGVKQPEEEAKVESVEEAPKPAPKKSVKKADTQAKQ